MKRFSPIIAMIHRDVIADMRDYKITLARLILQPAVYIFVFGYVIGDFFAIPGTHYAGIVAPGVIAIAVMNSALTNVGGTIVTGYYFRSMEGWLLSPLSLRSIMSARVMSGLIYGTVSGIIVTGLIWMILGIFPQNLMLHLLLIMTGALFFSLLTIALFLIPERPDKGQEIFSILLMPMTFFGCTFYSHKMLIPPFSYISLFFPTTYLSEGMRAAYNPETPHIDTNMIIAGLAAALTILFFTAQRAFQKRFKDFTW